MIVRGKANNCFCLQTTKGLRHPNVHTLLFSIVILGGFLPPLCFTSCSWPNSGKISFSLGYDTSPKKGKKVNVKFLPGEVSPLHNMALVPGHLTAWAQVFHICFLWLQSDLEFVKKFTRPNFRAKKFYTLKMRKWRLFSPAINSENVSLSVIWASFG